MVGFVLGRIFLIEAALMLSHGVRSDLRQWASIPFPGRCVPQPVELKLPRTLRSRRSGHRGAVGQECCCRFFGALPFVITGEIPSFVDAFF